MAFALHGTSVHKFIELHTWQYKSLYIVGNSILSISMTIISPDCMATYENGRFPPYRWSLLHRDFCVVYQGLKIYDAARSTTQPS